MTNRDEIAHAFHAATCIRRSHLYGTEHDGQMPESLAESAQVPCVGFVGRDFRQGGTVLLAVNPGGGGDAQDRTPGDAELETAILALRDGPPSACQRHLCEVTNAYVKQLKIISIGKMVVLPVLDACKSRFDDVAFLNLFPYRTRRNATPWAHAVQRALDEVTGPLVEALAPSRLIFLGKKARGMAGGRFGERKTFTIQRTNGDRYLCAAAKLEMRRIRIDNNHSE